ncbi:MAG: hypothetical protein EBX47_10325, partial [Synechococcaceae bacterium WB8_1B_057]|nr:hypothetical protein [Synechococcaceae bacterium WB8_1B_057]
TGLKYTSKIENRIKNDYGKNIVFVNNYIRVYLNDSTMGLHVDRDNLQITLSLNIFSNLDFDYPLYISNTELNPAHLHNLYNTKVAEIYKKDFTSWNTLTGSGVACLAQKYPHWRDDLFCRDDQMMIQAFFHWHYL